MLARVSVEGFIEVELPDEVAGMLAVSPHGVIVPTSWREEEDEEDLERDLVTLDFALREQLPAAIRSQLQDLDILSWSTVCRRCGCTDDSACAGGCRWVELDLCSACAGLRTPGVFAAEAGR